MPTVQYEPLLTHATLREFLKWLFFHPNDLQIPKLLLTLFRYIRYSYVQSYIWTYLEFLQDLIFYLQFTVTILSVRPFVLTFLFLFNAQLVFEHLVVLLLRNLRASANIIFYRWSAGCVHTCRLSVPSWCADLCGVWLNVQSVSIKKLCACTCSAMHTLSGGSDLQQHLHIPLDATNNVKKEVLARTLSLVFSCLQSTFWCHWPYGLNYSVYSNSSLNNPTTPQWQERERGFYSKPRHPAPRLRDKQMKTTRHLVLYAQGGFLDVGQHWGCIPIKVS